MAKRTERQRNNKVGSPPDPEDQIAFRSWLAGQPKEWSVSIASRVALRVLPLLEEAENLEKDVLWVFRANAIARFAAKNPTISARTFAAEAAAAVTNAPASAGFRSINATAAHAAFAVGRPAVDAARAAVSAVAAAVSAVSASSALAIYSAVKNDAIQLASGAVTSEQLATAPLWGVHSPARMDTAWRGLIKELSTDYGLDWSVWIDWCNDVAANASYELTDEARDAAFTDLPGKLPWIDGANAVNKTIARRLSDLSRGIKSPEIPEQSLAPFRDEERDRKVSKAFDRDSSLDASERDFNAWRRPVIEHIEELTASDFAAGTNHSRVRERLTRLGKLLPGKIFEVKENQFKIGYEIDRFEALMAAYRTGGEDMPVLNAAQLEDLEHLRVALRMGIDKLERWSEFRKQANESTAGEAEADREVVGDALDEMAAVMEQRPQYFHPELPATFRFLSESVRDPSGATKTIAYGAVKSAENLISFLGQMALGVGKKGAEAVENHISKGVAASLVAGLSGAALQLSGALPQGWVWLKPLLAALGVPG